MIVHRKRLEPDHRDEFNFMWSFQAEYVVTAIAVQFPWQARKQLISQITGRSISKPRSTRSRLTGSSVPEIHRQKSASLGDT